MRQQSLVTQNQENHYIFLNSNSVSANRFGKFIYGHFVEPKPQEDGYTLLFHPVMESSSNLSIPKLTLQSLLEIGIPIEDIDLETSFPDFFEESN